jgi:hypothetical protein
MRSATLSATYGSRHHHQPEVEASRGSGRDEDAGCSWVIMDSSSLYLLGQAASFVYLFAVSFGPRCLNGLKI